MKTHGMSHTREWKSWRAALSRCYYKPDRDYHNYGGRGIRVCARWRDDPCLFFSDMGTRPPGTSLDRIDTNGDYSPENCKWSTPKQQARGCRRVILLRIGLEERLLSEWCDETGIATDRANARLCMGWPSWDAVSRGKQKTGPRKAGETGRVVRLWKGSRSVDDHPDVRRLG